MWYIQLWLRHNSLLESKKPAHVGPLKMFVQGAKISRCTPVLLCLLVTQLKACTIPLYCLQSYQCALGWDELFFNVLTSCVLNVIFLLVVWKHSLKFHYTTNYLILNQT